LKGDHLLFTPKEMIETEWKLIQPILDVWSLLKPKDFPNYPAGSWGPKEADQLIMKDGRKWII
jgi:glucose-6-phosphate 1-dehydrogenase